MSFASAVVKAWGVTDPSIPPPPPPAPPRRDERQHTGSFRIRHFRQDNEIILTEREVKRNQLSPRLLAEASNRSVSVLRLCQSAFDVLTREATLRDEQWHDEPLDILRLSR